MSYLNSMKKSLIFYSFSTSLLLIVSCGRTDTINYSLLMPSGAPTLAIAEEVATNKNVIVTTNTNQVKDNFASNTYSYLVFDAINGINFEKNNVSNYEFVSLLTGGNFHLIGLNKKSLNEMKDEDYIIGFGNNNLIPNKIYNLLFKNREIDYLLPNITDLKNYISAIDQDGYINNLKIDWIFIAQPALFVLKSSSQNFSSIMENSLDINIREYFNAIYNMDYIPQAGLFVNKTFKQENPKLHEEFLTKIKSLQLDAINSPEKIKSILHSYSEDLSIQTEKFGFNENIAYYLQKNNNQFGIVDPNFNSNMNYIDSFLELL